MANSVLSFGDDSTSGVLSHLSQGTETRKRPRNSFELPNDETLLEVRTRCKKAIEHILANQKLPECYETYYRSVEVVCRARHAEQSQLADYISQEVTDHFHKNVKKRVELLVHENGTPEDTASGFLEVFNEWKRQLRTLSTLFLYLDRTYLMSHPARSTIIELGSGLFVGNLLVESAPTLKIIIDKYIVLLERNRVDKNLNDITSAFTTTLFWLNTNNRLSLHSKLITLIASQFTRLKAKWLTTPETYFQNALTCLTEEMAHFRAARAPKSFLRELLLRVKWILFFQDFRLILSKTISYVLQPQSKHQLQALYDFCRTSNSDYAFDSVPMFVFCWGEYIHKLVVSLIHDIPKGENWIQPLVDLYNRLEATCKTLFLGDDDFEFELRNSFSKAFNERKTNMQILTHLSKFCDAYLRESSKRAKKSAPPLTFDEFLQCVLLIFKLINNKDSFMVLYKRELSKRLLLSRSPNLDSEHSVVSSLLKLIGDSDMGREIDTMFSDISLSKLDHSLTIEGVEFSALILTKLCWPEIPGSVSDVQLPTQFCTILDEFAAKYYLSNDKFKDRVLDWSLYTLHQVEIVAQFENGAKELNLNVLQAAIVLLFNERDSYTIEELIQQTNIDEKLIRRVLVSLTEKYPILVASGSTYRYNSDFKDKNTKLKIPFIREKEMASMDQNSLRAIERNRNQEIRAAIVRTMKACKSATVPHLFDAVFKLVSPKGPISLDDFNTNLDFLVQSQYVLREATQIVYVP